MDKKPWLFEISWEVCNKVGGIHTVVTSKLGHIMREFPERYLAIGPYLGPDCDSFDEREIPVEWQPVFDQLNNEGIIAHYGVWLVDHEPVTILIDWSGTTFKLNDIKAKYWERYQLDSINSDFYDIDQPLLWSTAIGRFAEIFADTLDVTVIQQVHEWMSGGAILQTKLNDNSRVKSVFTTHATVLGRALCSRNIAIFRELDKIDPDQKAREVMVTTKHQIECFSARFADIFTTVSKLTAKEATAFLGRKPDVITENGLNTDEFPDFDQLSYIRHTSRELLKDFVSAYFFPSYRFDLDKTHFQFTIGRWEIHNKGYDTHLQALGKLNQEMKDSGDDRTILNFILVPADSRGLKPEILHQIMVYRYIRSILDKVAEGQERAMYLDLCQEKKPAAHLSNDNMETLRQLMNRLEQFEAPPISPFHLGSKDNESILVEIKKAGLLNLEEDRVKVVYFPIYFDGFDGIFNIPFYDILAGFDLGVFASFYEPWGYTPMESLIMSVPAITSTLAGFGLAIEERGLHELETNGVFLIDRDNLDDQSIDRLVEIFKQELDTPSRQWFDRRVKAWQAVRQFDWQDLFKLYIEAYELAVSPKS